MMESAVGKYLFVWRLNALSGELSSLQICLKIQNEYQERKKWDWSIPNRVYNMGGLNFKKH